MSQVSKWTTRINKNWERSFFCHAICGLKNKCIIVKPHGINSDQKRHSSRLGKMSLQACNAYRRLCTDTTLLHTQCTCIILPCLLKIQPTLTVWWSLVEEVITPEKKSKSLNKWRFILTNWGIVNSITLNLANTVEALLRDTLVSGQLYLWPPCLKARFNSHTNSLFLHSRKQTFP